MPVQTDFTIYSWADGVLTIGLDPPVGIGSQPITFQMSKRANGTPLINKYYASGFAGVSGINIINSGQGIFSISFNHAEASGLVPGAYFFNVNTTISGNVVPIAQGYRLMPQ